MTATIDHNHSEALVLITGITASRSDKKHLLDFYRTHTDYQVYLPTLSQYFGIRFAAWLLTAFLRRLNIAAYSRCHFICYISGGYILRCALSSSRLDNIGRVVMVRSPLQERVPECALRRYGRTLPLLSHGKILIDLAEDWKDRLPPIAAETGYVIEHGLSRLGQQLGLTSDDYWRYRHDPGFSIAENSPVLNSPLSHDEVYHNDNLLAQMTQFIASGQFP